MRHDQSLIEASIVWKVGLIQRVNIRRPRQNLLRDRLWTAEEESLLRMLWSSSSRGTLRAAFPEKSWHALEHKARHIGLKRPRVNWNPGCGPRWTAEDNRRLKDLYASEDSIDKIAEKLGRSECAVVARAHIIGVARPKELRYRKGKPTSESLAINVFQHSSSPSLS